VALTDAAIRALQPRKKRYVEPDSDGRELSVYPTGGKSWHFRYTFQGEGKRVGRGKYPALSLKNARIRRAELAAMVAMGQSPAELKQLAKTERAVSVTVEEFSKRYLREIVEKERKDAAKVRRYFDQSIVPALGR
jgi:hypothetical protein